jgi:hypothetical protein
MQLYAVYIKEYFLRKVAQEDSRCRLTSLGIARIMGRVTFSAFSTLKPAA